MNGDCTRQDFWDWFHLTCPCTTWQLVQDDYGQTTIRFFYDEDDEEED